MVRNCKVSKPKIVIHIIKLGKFSFDSKFCQEIVFRVFWLLEEQMEPNASRFINFGVPLNGKSL